MDLAPYQDWIGRKETAHDEADARTLAGMAAALDREPPRGTVPQGWHWLFFRQFPRQSALRQDGTAARGAFMPPLPLPLQMFGGARARFVRPLAIGEALSRETGIVGLSHRRGRSGDLVFVTIRQRIHGADGLAVEEEQDIIYRDQGPLPSARPRAVEPLPAHDWRRTVTPDAVLLFRISALIFNSHRIHYDRAYAMQAEGYPGLVMQGPLTATLLLELAKEHVPGRALATFEWTARAPLCDNSRFQIGGRMADDACHLWAADATGGRAMRATAHFL